MRVAYTMFCIGWGANMFASLLLLYRDHLHLSDTVVSEIFGVYALALMPSLLIGGKLSDSHGRRPILRIAAVASLLGSLLLIGGSDREWLLFAGRAMAGIASGLAFSAATAWVKELSFAEPPGTGARRAAVAMAGGFGGGGLVAGLIAQWAPAPAHTPYIVHIGMIGIALVLVWNAPERRERRTTLPATTVDDRPRPGIIALARSSQRFQRLIVTTAPWVFGSATVSMTVLPHLVAGRIPGKEIAFAGIITGLTQLIGVAIQPWAQHRERMGNRDALTIGMCVTAGGFLFSMIVASTGNPWWVVITAPIFGVGYGILLVSGLDEITRMADPRDLGGFVALFYALTYLGFALPILLAAILPVIDYRISFASCAVIVFSCALVVRRELVSEPKPTGIVNH
jgi:MFS family permease